MANENYSSLFCPHASITGNVKQGSRILRLRGLVLIAIGLFSTTLFGQNATFTGHVKDSSGAAVTKAQITVHNEGTGVDITTVTTGAGDYTVPYLRPGSYYVSAEAQGFNKENKVNITLHVSQVAVIDFMLHVGSVTQSVTVNADTLLDYGKADRGEVVENTRVTELPLNGRDPNMLSILNAGVIWTGSIQYQRPFDGSQANMSINGGGAGNNELMLDGVPNETTPTNGKNNGNTAYVPPVDSVQEFKIVTNPYDAQYGRLAGGVVDMTLKSGTNKLHGDAYEFARRTFLDDNTWQDNYYLAEKPANQAPYQTPQHSMDEYGAELDGPVLLPKVYDGRDRSFFLLQFENWHETEPLTITTSVPDPAWLTGDFSNLTWWTGSVYAPITIYDPLSLHDNGSGVLVRTPFPNNKINGALNPAAVKLMSYYPKPNVAPPPNSNPFANNYVTPAPAIDTYRNALAKWDENFSARDRFSLRYGYWERSEMRNENGMPGMAAKGGLPLAVRNHAFATEWTHTFTPNLLLDMRANAIVRYQYTNWGPTGFDYSTLGWPSSLISQLPQATGFPAISPSEFAGLGEGGSSGAVDNDLNLLPSVTWIKGRHTIHAGIDWRFLQYAPKTISNNPSLNVGRTWTQANYAGPSTPNSGNSFASMLLGTMDSGSAPVSVNPFWSQHYYAPFVQDDWKITSRLTLNLGVRYDVNGPQLERHNYVNYAFDTTDINPVDALLPTHTLTTGQTFQARGGVTFAGVNGNPRSYYSVSKLDIQPRAGFVYALNDKMVFRGGVGEMFQNPTPGGSTLGFSQSTSYVGTPDGGRTPIDNLSNPFPTIVQPVGASLGMLTGLGTGPATMNPNYGISNVWTFSAGYELELTKGDSVDVSYVGNRSPNQPTTDNINHWNAAAIVKCNVEMGGNPHVCQDTYSSNNAAIYGYVPNPFKGVAPFLGTSDYTATTVSALNFTEPFPEYSGITEWWLNGGHASYDSLQVTAIHRWNKSLTLHGTWTWSKLMGSGGWADSNYRIPYRGISGDDMPHRVTISGVYLLPVGRGRTLLSNSNRVVDGAIGGWELAALAIFQSGTPWGVPSGLTMVGNARVPRKTLTNGYIREVAPCVYSENQYTGVLTPEPYAATYGCTQPDFIQRSSSYEMVPNVIYTGIRIPGQVRLDTNLSKNFAVREDMKLQLRLEAFNVLNHPLWQSGFSGSVSDANFGTIERGPTGQSNVPRQIQLGAKLMW